ncbi:MAG: cytochrome-c peroxidase, partial [Flavobacterium sp.]
MKKAALLLMGLVFLGCKKQSEDADFSKPETVEKSELLTKAENFFKSVSTAQYEVIPESQDKLDLGKKLYFDKSLSKDQTVSCNSCHNLATFGVDNKPVSPGSNRNAPSVIYSSLQTLWFWDGHVKKGEEQIGKPMPNSIEHGVSNKEILEKRLRGNPEYQALFKKAFPNDKD